MTIIRRELGNKGLIVIPELFNASVYQDFKHACTMLINNHMIENIEVDLSATKYLDSAALGMLVQLNENAKYAKKSVMLISVPGRVSDTLKTTHIDRLFTSYIPLGMKHS